MSTQLIANPTAVPGRRPHGGRQQVRIHKSYHLRVRGADAAGRNFKLHTRLENVSAGGLYLYLPHRLVPGTRLTAIIRFSNRSQMDAPAAPRLAVRGVVLRVEPQADGRYGVAVAFTRHKFV